MEIFLKFGVAEINAFETVGIFSEPGLQPGKFDHFASLVHGLPIEKFYGITAFSHRAAFFVFCDIGVGVGRNPVRILHVVKDIRNLLLGH